MTNPIDVVIWSGGYDSTLLLNRLCSSGENNVWAFSIDWDMIDDNKRVMEKRVRSRYKRLFESRGHHFSYRTIQVTSDMSSSAGNIPQALMWLGVVLPYLPSVSNLYFGYHRGDDFLVISSFSSGRC